MAAKGLPISFLNPCQSFANLGLLVSRLARLVYDKVMSVASSKEQRKETPSASEIYAISRDIKNIS